MGTGVRLFERGSAYAAFRPLRAGDRRRMAVMLERCPVAASGTVLEVGCGTGKLLRHLAAEAPGRRLIGVDPAAAMLSEARGLAVVRGVAEALPLAGASADLVFASLAFHHFQDQPGAAREFHRVLRPGGHAAIWTATPEHVRDYVLNRWFPSLEAIDRPRFPPPEEWARLLVDAGFADVRVERLRVARRVRLRWLARAAEERYISTFDRLPDAEFRSGLDRLRQEAARAPERRLDAGMGWALIRGRRASD